jgi:hypothetical protein
LAVGGHSITVSYGGDISFTSSTSGALTQNVNQAGSTTTVNSAVNPSVFGQGVTFTATVTANGPGAGTPSGSVTFFDGSTALGSATLSAGSASFTTAALAVGGHTITVSYGGDTDFTASSSSALSQTVNQDGTASTVSSSNNPSIIGQSVTFTATVTANSPGAGTPTGSVSFLDGTSVLASVPLNNGSAAFSTSSLAVGSHPITVQYGSDADFTASTSSVLTQVVNLAGTTTSLTASVNPSAFGQNVTFTATVSPVSGSVTPTGTVTFLDGSTVLGSASLSSGSANFSTATLPAGSHSITASYGGSSTYAGSTSPVLTQVVNVDPTTTTVTSSLNPSVFGQNVTFTATVHATAPGSGIPTGSVTFFDGTTQIGTGTLASGSATLVTNALVAGSHSITVSYASDGNFGSSTSAALGQTVNQAATTIKVATSGTPAVFGQTVTFTATITVSSPGSGSPTGQVTFLDHGAAIGTGTLSGSTATFSTSSLAVGKHSISVSYGGDGNFKGSTSSSITQTINQASTTTTVVSSLNPSVVGQPVTFTATVVAKAPGSGMPTGSVTFKNGSTTLGTVPLDGTGHASFTTSSLSIGNHSITAVYGGDTNFRTSTSPRLTQTVNSSGGVHRGANSLIAVSRMDAAIGTAGMLSTAPVTDLALGSFTAFSTADTGNSHEGSDLAVTDQIFAELANAAAKKQKAVLENDGV